MPRNESVACRAARQDAAEAWVAVANEAGNAQPSSRRDDTARLLTRLLRHREAVATSRQEVAPAVAMELSERLLDVVDAHAAEATVETRRRTEDAAETLLTMRSPQAAQRAAAGAIAVLEAFQREVDPEGARIREAIVRFETLARRAQDAARAYRRGASEGDRAAQRAEATTHDVGAPSVAAAAHEASGASRLVRTACGVQRTIALPVR